MGSTLVRAGLLALALLAGAWLVLSFRGVELQANGQALAERARQGPVPAAEIRRAQDDLRRAGRLSADNEPLLTEGLLLLAARRKDDAAAIARQVAKDEPDNVEAWFLAFFSAPDRASLQQARRHVRRLDPWAADFLN